MPAAAAMPLASSDPPPPPPLLAVAAEMNCMSRLNVCVLPAPLSPEMTTDWLRPWLMPRCRIAAVRNTCGGGSLSEPRYRCSIASE